MQFKDAMLGNIRELMGIKGGGTHALLKKPSALINREVRDS